MGYLGLLLIGLALLLAALKTKADRIIMSACGAGLLLIAALYISGCFALIFSGVTGLAMLACARWLPRDANDLGLRVIGLASIIDVRFDLLSHTILRASVGSDAWILAAEFGGPTVFLGGLWLLISAAKIFSALKVALREPSNLTFKSG